MSVVIGAKSVEAMGQSLPQLKTMGEAPPQTVFPFPPHYSTSARFHTITNSSFFNKTIETGAIFHSKCSRNYLVAGLRLDPLEEFIAVHQPPSWISALGSQTETDKGLMEKERHRKGEKKGKDKKKARKGKKKGGKG